MRARNLKPGFFKNEELAEVDMAGRLLFQGLWLLADRAGRLEDRPKRIKAEILPYDDCDVDALLDTLADKQFIVRYEHGGGRYIQVTNFEKHQNPHVKEAPSTIPAPGELAPEQGTPDADTSDAPDEHHTNTVQAPDSHSTNPAESPFLDSPFSEEIAASDVAAASNGHKATKPPALKRLDQEMHDALTDEFGYGPANDVERQRWNKANKLLRDAGVLPEDVPRLHAAYRRKYAHASDTVMALAGRAGELLAESRREAERVPNVWAMEN